MERTSARWMSNALVLVLAWLGSDQHPQGGMELGARWDGGLTWGKPGFVASDEEGLTLSLGGAHKGLAVEMDVGAARAFGDDGWIVRRAVKAMVGFGVMSMGVDHQAGGAVDWDDTLWFSRRNMQSTAFAMEFPAMFYMRDEILGHELRVMPTAVQVGGITSLSTLQPAPLTHGFTLSLETAAFKWSSWTGRESFDLAFFKAQIRSMDLNPGRTPKNRFFTTDISDIHIHVLDFNGWQISDSLALSARAGFSILGRQSVRNDPESLAEAALPSTSAPPKDERKGVFSSDDAVFFSGRVGLNWTPSAHLALDLNMSTFARIEPTMLGIDYGPKATVGISWFEDKDTLWRLELLGTMTERVAAARYTPPGTKRLQVGQRLYMGRAALSHTWTVRQWLALEATAWAEHSDRDDPLFFESQAPTEPRAIFGGRLQAVVSF